MVELDSYSSVDWSDSAISLDKAETLKSRSSKDRLLHTPELDSPSRLKSQA